MSIDRPWVSLKGGITREKTIEEGGERRGEDSNRWNISCLGPRAPAALRHDVPAYTASTATLSDGLRPKVASQANKGTHCPKGLRCRIVISCDRTKEEMKKESILRSRQYQDMNRVEGGIRFSLSEDSRMCRRNK